MKRRHSDLHILSFGLAVGVTWALGIFILGIINLFGTWGIALIEPMASIYIGYTATFIGSFIGAIWAFIDGFIGGIILAWLYNSFHGCCGNHTEGSDS